MRILRYTLVIILLCFALYGHSQSLGAEIQVMKWDKWSSELEDSNTVRYDSANTSFWVIDSTISKLRVSYPYEWVADYYNKIYSNDDRFTQLSAKRWYFIPGEYYITITIKDEEVVVYFEK